VDLAATPAPVLPTRRLGRAALFTFGATLAAGLSGSACGSDDSGGGSSGGSGGSAGSAGDASYAGTGGAIYGCGPFVSPEGGCSFPDAGDDADVSG